MAKERDVYQNEEVIGQMHRVCTDAAMIVTKDTDGVNRTTSTTAKELDNDLVMINNVIEHELSRRYGA